jgi:hypothetical protein
MVCACWALVRVERKADKGKKPRELQPPCTVGDAVDAVHCVFCTAVFSAQPQRVRMHFAFVGEA